MFRSCSLALKARAQTLAGREAWEGGRPLPGHQLLFVSKAGAGPASSRGWGAQAAPPPRFGMRGREPAGLGLLHPHTEGTLKPPGVFSTLVFNCITPEFFNLVHLRGKGKVGLPCGARRPLWLGHHSRGRWRSPGSSLGSEITSSYFQPSLQSL